MSQCRDCLRGACDGIRLCWQCVDRYTSLGEISPDDRERIRTIVGLSRRGVVDAERRPVVVAGGDIMRRNRSGVKL